MTRLVVLRYGKVVAIAILLMSAACVVQYIDAGTTIHRVLFTKFSNAGSGDFPSQEKSSNREDVTARLWEGSILMSSIPSSIIPLVTSGSELLNLSLANVRTRNVFHNRLKKTGSRSLLAACRRIVEKHNITFEQSYEYKDEHPNRNSMLEELRMISELKLPTMYNRHIHYLDFQHYNVTSPIYINVLRDPISRFTSWFNYVKYGDVKGSMKNSRRANLSHINQCVTKSEPYCRSSYFAFYYTDYFCGFDPVCNGSSPQKRVELAKKHIDENYLVIGISEEFENTIKLLEKMIPEYFEGLMNAWETLENYIKRGTKTKTKDFLSPEATKVLREILKYDYEVYEHAKAKYERLKLEYGIS